MVFNLVIILWPQLKAAVIFIVGPSRLCASFIFLLFPFFIPCSRSLARHIPILHIGQSYSLYAFRKWIFAFVVRRPWRSRAINLCNMLTMLFLAFTRQFLPLLSGLLFASIDSVCFMHIHMKNIVADPLPFGKLRAKCLGWQELVLLNPHAQMVHLIAMNSLS